VKERRNPEEQPWHLHQSFARQVLPGVADTSRDAEHVGRRHADVRANQLPITQKRRLHAVHELIVHDRPAAQEDEHHASRQRHARAGREQRRAA
jgi:hypothetical protein